MKKNLGMLLALGLILSLILVSGCISNSQEKTIQFKPDGYGFLQLYTDNKQCYNHWFAFLYDQINNPMIPVEIQAKKYSGYYYHGYGMIFCAQDMDNYYRVMISCDGKYNIWKLVAGNPIMIRDWTPNANLHTGYGSLNTIQVTFDGADTFSIFFNDSLIADGTFTDTDFTGGKYGYYVVVGDSSQENFPNQPVDVRFKKNLPTASLWQKAAGMTQFGRLVAGDQPPY